MRNPTLRIPCTAHDIALLQRAAKFVGMELEKFVLMAASSRAVDELAEQREIIMSAEEMTDLLEMLYDPMRNRETLQRLAEIPRPWKETEPGRDRSDNQE